MLFKRESKVESRESCFGKRKACLGDLPVELSNWRRRVQRAIEMARLRPFIVYVDSICSSKASLHFRYIGIDVPERKACGATKSKLLSVEIGSGERYFGRI